MSSSKYKPIEASMYNVKDVLAHFINMMRYEQIDGFEVAKGTNKEYLIRPLYECEETKNA